MPTPDRFEEDKHEILERIGRVASAEELEGILRDLQARHPLPEEAAEGAAPMSGPVYDPLVEDEDEPELLGSAGRLERSWGTLAAAAVFLVAILGVFLWHQRSMTPSAPPYAPPPAVAEPRAESTPAIPAAAEPEVIEEPPVDFEPEPEPVPEESPRPVPARPVRRAAPPVQVAAVRESPAPKRAVFSGPPAERMAGVLRPGPGVEMPVPLDFPRARYPEAARGTGLKVDVHLDLLVDEQGKVVDALVREGDSSGLGFNEAAVKAARATPFQPATRWDLPGKAWTELILEFAEPVLERERGR